MQLPTNPFKQALQTGRPQIGFWLGLADPYCAEICAGAGFDWLLLDAEHGPNTLQTLLSQLQAIAPYPSHPIVRATLGDTAHIKQLLDIGAQTLLVPLVETAAQAAEIVRATRYPPAGARGVGSALARASRWNRISDYLLRADDEICLLVQVESAAALQNVEAIARTDGVDGVFIGPADLAASLGFRGNPSHPTVREAIEQAIRTIVAAGKPAGTLSADETVARWAIAAGCTFVAVGVDTTTLARATSTLAERFKSTSTTGTGSTQTPHGSVY
jgi:4-hydroxy-2-oxoheptanedioate aldolase